MFIKNDIEIQNEVGLSVQIPGLSCEWKIIHLLRNFLLSVVLSVSVSQQQITK